MDEDILYRVEEQRLGLEENVAKLRKALRHWQALELDYEGLKDEFQSLDNNSTKDQYINAAHDFAPHKVDDKELNDLIEPSKGKLRLPAEVVATLTKRVEYVTRNIETLRVQISDLERKRNALLLAENVEHEGEAGLPIAEITEELDDDGNVISSKVEPQSETATKVLNVLEKAKVESSPDIAKPEFVENLNEDVNDEPHATHAKEFQGQSKADMPIKASETASLHGPKDSSIDEEFPSNPEDTEEEAKLRREMLQYGLGEVNNIVAELELAEAGDSANEDYDEDADMTEPISDEDVDSWDDEDSEDDGEDSEGQINHSEKYKRQMEDLESRLGMKMENVGPAPTLPKEIQEHIEVLPRDEADKYIETLPPQFREQLNASFKPPPKEAARKAAIARAEANKSSMKENTNQTQTKSKTKAKSKKKVAFAKDLDIADEGDSTAKPRPATTTESVLERTTTSASTETPSAPSANPSRFKAARSSQLQEPQIPLSHQPTSPQPSTSTSTRTHSHTLVERPLASRSTPPTAPDPNDFDTALQARQIALEHHKLRNKMIHDQGGYVRGGEDENWGEEFAAPEITDEKTGETRKISRFKAARMRP